jgi:uridine kinase
MAAEMTWTDIDNEKVEIPVGTSLLTYLQDQNLADKDAENPVVMASINGRRTTLREPILGDERIRLIRLFDREAQATNQRTILFLLAVAAEELFPEDKLSVDFSYGGGMYCELQDGVALDAGQVAALEKRMHELVAQDLPLTPQLLGLRAVLKIHQRRNDEQSYTSARYLRRDSLVLYKMEGSSHLYYGRQLPSTGFVRAFRLVPEDPGFVLLSNIGGQPDQVPEFSSQPKLLDTLREYSSWAENLGVQDTGHMNEYIVQGRTSELIQTSEARHAKFFVDAADQVASLPEGGRLVLLAGPSSSGKTSCAKRLSVQLRVLGFKPYALSLDNYFVDREDTPLDQDGDYDYEALTALRIDLFNEHLKALMAGEEVFLPRYDFISGKSELSVEPTRLDPSQPLIVEGIHALNPGLTPAIPASDKLLIYVSALCHLNIDNFSYIKTTHSRLFRRIVRDAQFRGYTASETLARWPKVRRGEEKHIFPFQNNADLFFNSGLTYEMAVLKLWAEPRLAAVESDDPFYGLARSMIDRLSLLLPIDASQVPPTSLLREFIGGSGFNY